MIFMDKLLNKLKNTGKPYAMIYLQVDALSEWTIGVYPHEFTNNEREISKPQEALPSAVLKISSSLFVNVYR